MGAVLALHQRLHSRRLRHRRPLRSLPTPQLDRIALSESDITPPAEAIDLKGAVSLAFSDITAPTEAVAVKGAISLALTDITAPVEAVPLRGDINQLTVSAVPPIIYLKGIINDLMVDSAAVVPAPIGLGGIINKLTTDPSAEIPAVSPAAIIRSITTDPSAEIPAVSPAAIIRSITTTRQPKSLSSTPAGVINSLEIGADTQTPVVNPQGEINNLLLSPIAVPPNVDLTGEITEINKNFTEPIPLKAIADVELNLPDTDLLPPINLGGIRFSNLPQIPLSFALDPNAISEAIKDALGTSDNDEGGAREGFVDTKTGDEGTDNTGTTNLADVVAKEGRRDKVFGSDTTTQTNITPEELTQAIVDGTRRAKAIEDFLICHERSLRAYKVLFLLCLRPVFLSAAMACPSVLTRAD